MGETNMSPDWTITNIVVQAVAGILGAHIAAAAAREFRFGFIGHSIVGLIAGTLSGDFLQRVAVTTVYGTGMPMPISPVEAGVCQALTGAVVGGIAMMVIGFLRHEMMQTPRE
jgi:hypothetical protein